MPKVYNCQIWLKREIIREIFKGDYNGVAVEAGVARKLKRKQISALSGMFNYSVMVQSFPKSYQLEILGVIEKNQNNTILQSKINMWEKFHIP